MSSVATSPPDSFYIEFLKKAYPNNPEFHALSAGLVKFAQDTYPADPKLHTADLAKRAIRSIVNRNVKVEVPNKYSKYKAKSISQFLADEYVQADVVVLDRQPTITYVGCPQCTRKVCGEHNDLKVPIYFHQFLVQDVIDGHSQIVVSFKAGETFDEVRGGDKIRIYGRVKRYKESLNMRVYEFLVLRKVEVPLLEIKEESQGNGAVDKLMSEIKEFTKIPSRVFDERMKQEGVTLDMFQNKVRYVENETGKFYEVVTNG